MSMSLENEIALLLHNTGLTLATAESATGGMISETITNVPGSSSYYKGSVISYAYEIKERVLGVKSEVLQEYGAVSRQVAGEMAQGVRRLMNTDIGISDTGIAGPTGGTPEKPVGLFYLGLSAADGDIIEEHIFCGNRLTIRQAATQATLTMLRDYLFKTHKSC